MAFACRFVLKRDILCFYTVVGIAMDDSQFCIVRPSVLDDPVRAHREPPECLHVHLTHKIAAGFPSPASDYMEPGLDLNEYLVPNKASSFLFTVTGDSMAGAGIMDGDKVIVDRSVSPVHGKIVIAVVNAEYTLKRLFHFNGMLELRSETKAYSPIRMVEGCELEIWGVVVGVVRRYRG